MPVKGIKGVKCDTACFIMRDFSILCAIRACLLATKNIEHQWTDLPRHPKTSFNGALSMGMCDINIRWKYGCLVVNIHYETFMYEKWGCFLLMSELFGLMIKFLKFSELNALNLGKYCRIISPHLWKICAEISENSPRIKKIVKCT